MKWKITFLVCGVFAAANAAEVKPADYYGEIAKRVCSILPRRHVLQHPLDDEISQRAWTNLVTMYDFDHSVFLQSDLDALARRTFTLDDELKMGDVSFGFDLHNLYCKRLNERIDFATNLLAKTEWDFSTNETHRIKRKDAPWPATVEEAEEHWRRRMKNEMLAQIISRELEAEDKKNGKKLSDADSQMISGDITASDVGLGDDDDDDPAKSPAENLIKRYHQYGVVMSEPDEETVMQRYMSAVARAYDPHTDYMSPTTKEEFDMDMNLKLCGVGSVLNMDDGALKIAEIMPGGPIDVDGRIQEGDKIVGVAQGDGEMEDILWQPMKKSIRKIRGEKGTRVTLEIIPRSDPSGATKRRIELVRDEIKLEDQAATGRVERVTIDGRPAKLGYVYLPSFYGSMDKRPGDDDYRGCSDDVLTYLANFNAQDVEGLVLDLRGDGGGSLLEAIRLSGLFVANGPVVQIRDLRSINSLPIPYGNNVAFRKPVVVLIDRASASASEIVAGHLRDTGRAVVLGDSSSHGKGTVQTLMPFEGWGRQDERYGSMKITTARFYRVDGRSTQVKGVESDIHLPSLLDSLEIGEDKLTYALPFTRIRAARYSQCWNMPSYLPQLKEASEKRLAGNERYIKHLANVSGMKEIGDREEVPLEYEARKAMMREDRKIRELDENAGGDDAAAENADAGAKPPDGAGADATGESVGADADMDAEDAGADDAAATAEGDDATAEDADADGADANVDADDAEGADAAATADDAEGADTAATAASADAKPAAGAKSEGAGAKKKGEKKKKNSRRHRNRLKEDDVVLDEAFNVLSDLIRLTKGEELPVIRRGWLESILEY